jgi:hypothetical protein
MRSKQVGRIVVPPGAFVSIHEKLAADFLASKMYYDLTFLAPNRRAGAKTPDIEMNGLLWERRFNDAKTIRYIIVITRQETAVDFKR